MTVKEHEIRWSASEIPLGAKVHMFSEDGTPTREYGRKDGREMEFVYLLRGSGGSGATVLYALDANGKTEVAVSPKSLREDLYFSPVEAFKRETADRGVYVMYDVEGVVIKEIIITKPGTFWEDAAGISKRCDVPPDAVLVKIGEYKPLP